MCQVIPYTLPCCRRVYVEVSKLPSCPDEWPKSKCPADLCIQVGDSEPNHRATGVCWRCKALRRGVVGFERENMRPRINRAFIVDGLEEYGVEGRKHNMEKQGKCWYCGARADCSECGTGNIKVSRRGETPEDTEDQPPAKKRKRGAAAPKGKGPVDRLKQEARVRQKHTPPRFTSLQNTQGQIFYGGSTVQPFAFSDPGPPSEMQSGNPQNSVAAQPSIMLTDPNNFASSQASYAQFPFDTQQPTQAFTYPSPESAARGYAQPQPPSQPSSKFASPTQVFYRQDDTFNNVSNGGGTWGTQQVGADNLTENVSYDGFGAWSSGVNENMTGLNHNNAQSSMSQVPVTQSQSQSQSQYPDLEDPNNRGFHLKTEYSPPQTSTNVGTGESASKFHSGTLDKTDPDGLNELYLGYDNEEIDLSQYETSWTM